MTRIGWLLIVVGCLLIIGSHVFFWVMEFRTRHP